MEVKMRKRSRWKHSKMEYTDVKFKIVRDLKKGCVQ